LRAGLFLLLKGTLSTILQPIEERILQFIAWSKLKVRLHIKPDNGVYFREREIWWASLGANIGYEQDGKHENFERPVLVLKKFSRHTPGRCPSPAG